MKPQNRFYAKLNAINLVLALAELYTRTLTTRTRGIRTCESKCAIAAAQNVCKMQLRIFFRSVE